MNTLSGDTYTAASAVAMETKATRERFGAVETDWMHFAQILGLSSDLLSTVCNPNATISGHSSLKALGKVPSRYNRERQAVGIVNWTSHVSTDADLAKWSKESDYGICLITRSVRAIDVDIDDPDQAAAVRAAISGQLGINLPIRTRSNNPKFLMLFSLPGELPKRVFKTTRGMVEMLGSGQQCVVSGTHPSGARYEWTDGLPSQIPALTLNEFEALWSLLEKKFAIEPSVTSNASVKISKLANAAANDPTAVALMDRGWVLATEADARMHITCPWEEDHTPGTGGVTATTYWPASTGGFQLGHFKCLHASHADKTDNDFLEAIGIAHDPRDDFEALVFEGEQDEAPKRARFEFVPAGDFSSGPSMGWFVKDVIPKAELGVVYGPPKCGKTFWVTDIAAAISRGVESWCGKRVHRGRVGYVAAEGAGGLRGRLSAYSTHAGIGIHELPLMVLAAVPNLMKKQDIDELVGSIKRGGGLDLLIYDTLARGTTGGDENSAKDMGIAIENCRQLHAQTGAMVILIHHSGKVVSKGARGSNSILGAVDVEIEISRTKDNRTATVANLKDGADGGQFGFRLQVVPLGMDEDGDVVSSCVVEHTTVSKRKPKGERMGLAQQRVWKAVVDCQRLDGSNPSVDEVLDAAVAATALDPAARRDQRRGHNDKVLRAFERRGMLTIEGGFVLISEGK